MKYEIEKGRLIDRKNHNMARIEYWGSVEKAEAALDSLVKCGFCTDCENCSGCYDCSRCKNCHHCYDSYECDNCDFCYTCDMCVGCKECYGEDKVTNKTPDYIVPEVKNIHQTVYTAASKRGALYMDAWHSCSTTHCRAGWVVHLAGDAGYKLEQQTSPEYAAVMIYKKSGYVINPRNFFVDGETAMADMKRLAEQE